MTLFGPTDDAFLALPEDTRNELSSDNKTLANVISFHIVNASVMIESVLVNNYQLKTLNGQLIRINLYRNNSVSIEIK